MSPDSALLVDQVGIFLKGLEIAVAHRMLQFADRHPDSAGDIRHSPGSDKLPPTASSVSNSVIGW